MTLTQLAAGLPVDVMPGEGDPASAALPQQPLHRRAPPVWRVWAHCARVACCLCSTVCSLHCKSSRDHGEEAPDPLPHSLQALHIVALMIGPTSTF